MKKGILIVVGVGAIGGLAYWLYNKNKTAAATAPASPGAGIDYNNPQQSNVQASLPAGSSSYVPAVAAQTMWKDPDGHTFELVTSSEDKYGFLLKVDGGGNSKAVTVSQGPDGYITIKNKVNETWKFKNGWQRLSGLSGLNGKVGMPVWQMT